MDRNRDLVRRFEEQTVTIRDMNREIVDMRSQLTVTHQGRETTYREIVDMRSQLTVTHQGRETTYVVESLGCSLECGRLWV